MKIGLFSVFLTLILFFKPCFYPTPSPKTIRSGNYQRVPSARLGKGGIRKIQYSPDNRFLAVASTIGIWIYDAVTLQEARPLCRKCGWDFLCVAESRWTYFCSWQRSRFSNSGIPSSASIRQHSLGIRMGYST